MTDQNKALLEGTFSSNELPRIPEQPRAPKRTYLDKVKDISVGPIESTEMNLTKYNLEGQSDCTGAKYAPYINVLKVGQSRLVPSSVANLISAYYGMLNYPKYDDNGAVIIITIRKDKTVPGYHRVYRLSKEDALIYKKSYNKRKRS